MATGRHLIKRTLDLEENLDFLDLTIRLSKLVNQKFPGTLLAVLRALPDGALTDRIIGQDNHVPLPTGTRYLSLWRYGGKTLRESVGYMRQPLTNFDGFVYVSVMEPSERLAREVRDVNETRAFFKEYLPTFRGQEFLAFIRKHS